jgi:hypothetical protein
VFGIQEKVYLVLTLHLCMDKGLFLPFHFSCYTTVIFIGYNIYYHENFLTNFMSFNDYLIVSAFKP